MDYDCDKQSNTGKADDVIKAMFKKGRISAPEAQETADAIASSSSSGPANAVGLEDWAKAGSGGKQKGNMSRDVI